MAEWHSVSFSVPEAQKLADLAGVETDLLATERFCDRFISEAEKETPDPQILEIICAVAIIRYGRTFPSGVRSGVESTLIAELDPIHQEAHQFFKALRDKWIAHSVNTFEENEVVAWLMPPERGPIGVTGITVRQSRVSSLSVKSVAELKDLCVAVRCKVKEAMAAETELVLKLAQSLPPEGFYSQIGQAVSIPGIGGPSKTRSQKQSVPPMQGSRLSK